MSPSKEPPENPPLAEQFRRHFGHQDHLYGVLLARLADDLEDGGVTARIVRDQLGAPRGDAIQLRLLAGLHRILLRGQEPDLAQFYPNLGGTRRAAEVWPVLQPVLLAHEEELRQSLTQAPQTNEVGRSALLVLGLFAAVRAHGIRRIRLLEPGASAGLNLLVDRFRFTGPGWSWGPGESPLVIETQASGVVPEDFDIVSRRGCDLAPLDANDPEVALNLRSYVWPFDEHRGHRLEAALAVASQDPATIDEGSAAAWLEGQLQEAPADTLTVVWQSITAQYWPAAETRAARETIEAARARMPLAHITMEGVPPAQTTRGYDIRANGPRTEVDGVLIAHSHHHGPPVLLAEDA